MNNQFETATVENRMVLVAYSAEVDRLFRANVTGDSAESVVAGFSTLVGHDQSIFQQLSGSVTEFVA